MGDILKFISESVTNYLFFLVTVLLCYMLFVTAVNLIINKIIVAVITIIQVVKDKEGRLPKVESE
jgi:hypothetical protein